MTHGGQEPELTLRPATPEDLPFLREMCYQAAFGGQHEAAEKPPSFEEAMKIPWVREYVEGWGREGDYGLVAVNDAGENVGAAWYRRYSGEAHAGPYELSMAVRQPDRRRYVGERLLNNLMAHAAEEGITSIGLQVNEANTAARNLYKKLGFLVTADKDEYDNYRMAAALSADATSVPAEETPAPDGSGTDTSGQAGVAGYFDAFAPLHDRYAAGGDWTAKAEGFAETAVELKPYGRIGSVLDLGAGTGLSIDAVTRHARPDRIVAVDISPNMLERALRKYDDRSRIEPVVAAIEDYVSESEETFDVIMSLTTMEFVRDLPEVLRRLPRLLNPGGIFAATYIDRSEEKRASQTQSSTYLRQDLTSYFWPREEIEASLTSGGLKIVHRDDSLPAYKLGDKWVNYNFVVATKPNV